MKFLTFALKYTEKVSTCRASWPSTRKSCFQVLSVAAMQCNAKHGLQGFFDRNVLLKPFNNWHRFVDLFCKESCISSCFSAVSSWFESCHYPIPYQSPPSFSPKKTKKEQKGKIFFEEKAFCVFYLNAYFIHLLIMGSCYANDFEIYSG